MSDVTIIGDGVIGLSTALELAKLGASVHVFGARKTGVASEAAAGLLAPSIGDLPHAIRLFFNASLELYPDFVERLREFDPDLSLVTGLLEIPPETTAERADPGARLLSADEVAAEEPSVFAPAGAVFYEHEGAVDNVRLVRALRLAVAADPLVSVSRESAVAAIEWRDSERPTCVTDRGEQVESESTVLAAGAWSSQLAGLPRALPVLPLKGQMLAVASMSLRHAIVGADVYLVPRKTEVVIGATTEHAGFDTTVDETSIDALLRSAIEVCPALSKSPILRSWAGIRPATPDMFPIIGPDPDRPRLVYATGHSKNGILLAPATALAVASTALKRPSSLDIAPFSIARFASR